MRRYRISDALGATGCALWSWGQLGTFALMAVLLSASASLAQETARRVWLEGPEPSASDLVYSLMLDDATDVLAIEVDLLFADPVPGGAWVRRTAMLQGFLLASNVLDKQVLIALAGTEAAAGSGAFAQVVIPNPGQSPAVGLARVLLNGGGIPVEYERAVAASVPEDFDGDGTVGFSDFFLLADYFGLAAGDPGYDPLYDLDGNSSIGFADFFLFADAFGTTY
jgi:hypothetical protein